MDIHLRKRKFPQQNINRVGMVRMKREAGQVNWMIGLFVVLYRRRQKQQAVFGTLGAKSKSAHGYGYVSS